MGDKTGIEWTDATWNPIAGCSVVSPGCTNCYAMKVAHRLGSMPAMQKKYGGLTKVVNGNPVWTGDVRLDESALDQPIRWRRPRRIFVNSMSDLFHEALPDEAIDRVFAVVALSGRHTFQVLTKRAERMQDYITRLSKNIKPLEEQARAMGYTFNFQGISLLRFPLRNLWLGVSAEDQRRADERVPLLLETPAAVRFVSAEPLLGPVHFGYLGWPNDRPSPREGANALLGFRYEGGRVIERLPKLDWIIVGGESAPSARPMHPEWVRSIREQCQAAGIAFHFKQWGEWHPDALLHTEAGTQICPPPSMKIGKKKSGRLLDGRTWDEYPTVSSLTAAV